MFLLFDDPVWVLSDFDEIMNIIFGTHFMINKIIHVQFALILSILQRPLYLSKLYVTPQQNMTLACFMTIQLRLKKKY